MKISGQGSVSQGFSAPEMPGVGQTAATGMVDKILEVEKQPIEALTRRKDRVVQERNEFNSLSTMLGDLGGVLDGLRSPDKFAKLKADSSHPDILEGVVSGAAQVGSYEVEVGGLAKADKHLAFGFPDADKTEVGFGFMSIERAGKDMLDVVIDPGSTLKDVAERINSSSDDVRASIINTGDAEEPFRLMVASTKTGEASRISLDADTTFLDFKSQVAGQDLKMKFEDVDISRSENSFNDLVDGLALSAKRAEPGTKVQLNVTHDVDATMTGIKDFTDKFNNIASYVQSQSAVDPSTGKSSGLLSADSSLRSVMRSLQGNMSGIAASGDGKFKTLADVGITTNPKTGTLNVDDAKLKSALASDYDGVAKIFARSESGEGVAERLSKAVKHLQSDEGGAVKGRLKTLDTVIRQHDQNIDRQSRRMETREADLRRKFNGLDSKLAAMQGQQQFLSAKFGTPSAEGQ